MIQRIVSLWSGWLHVLNQLDIWDVWCQGRGMLSTVWLNKKRSCTLGVSFTHIISPPFFIKFTIGLHVPPLHIMHAKIKLIRGWELPHQKEIQISVLFYFSIEIDFMVELDGQWYPLIYFFFMHEMLWELPNPLTCLGKYWFQMKLLMVYEQHCFASNLDWSWLCVQVFVSTCICLYM